MYGAVFMCKVTVGCKKRREQAPALPVRRNFVCNFMGRCGHRPLRVSRSFCGRFVNRPYYAKPTGSACRGVCILFCFWGIYTSSVGYADSFPSRGSRLVAGAMNISNDGDGDDDILNSHNFLSHDRYKNRYHFRELDVLVKSFWNVIYHLNWVRFASRNLNCLCSLTLLLIKLIATD